MKSPYGRTRERVKSQTVVPNRTDTVYDVSGSVEDFLVRDTIVLDNKEVMTDVVTPGFSRLVREGFFVANGMDHSQELTAVSTGIQTYVFHDRPFAAWRATEVDSGCLDYYDHPAWFPGLPKPPVAVDLAGAALTAAFAQANGQAAALLVDMAEATKTLELLKSKSEQLLKLLASPSILMSKREMKRLQKRGARVLLSTGKLGRAARGISGAARFAASEYMTFRYGVAPLVYSIQDYREAISEILSRSTRITGRATKTDDQSSSASKSNTYTVFYGAGAQPATAECTCEIRVQTEYHAGVILDVRPSASKILGIDLLAIPSAGYELIPYSWLVDWWLGIGEWLQSLNTPPGATMRTSWVSTTRLETRKWHCMRPGVESSGGTDAAAYSMTYSGCANEFRTVRQSKSRSVNHDRPFHPSFNPNGLSNLSRTLDLCSLVILKGTQQMRGIRR